MTRRAAAHADDRGAVLIYVAVAMVGLLAMATYVVDFGMFWVARQQAQNAADAAAYAAAIALAGDPAGDKTDGGVAKQTALAMGRRNLVWGEQASVLAGDITFPACPGDGTDMCVRVAVYRNQARGNPLPTVFGRLIGLTTQDVQAVATAEVRPGNTATCVRPWAIPDRWADHSAPANSTFDKYSAPSVSLPDPDIYTKPTSSTPGTGYQLSLNLGTPLKLHQSCSAAASCPPATVDRDVAGVETSGFLPVNLAPGCPSSTYANWIKGCATKCDGSLVKVVPDDPLTFLQGASPAANTASAVQFLVNLDPGATYNPLTKKVENSCVGGGGIPYSCAQPGLVESPRIVAVPTYDVNWFEDHRQTGGTTGNLIKVSNILGVFVEGMSGADVSTHIVTKSGGFDSTKGVVTGGSAFTRTLLIVR